MDPDDAPKLTQIAQEAFQLQLNSEQLAALWLALNAHWELLERPEALDGAVTLRAVKQLIRAIRPMIGPVLERLVTPKAPRHFGPVTSALLDLSAFRNEAKKLGYKPKRK